MKTKQTFKIGDKIKAVDIGGCIWITHNKIYEVVGVDSDGDPYIINDPGDENVYFSYRFKLVENDLPSIEEQIKLAKSYLHKNVRPIAGGDEGIVFEILVHIKKPNSSGGVMDFYKEHGYCVEVKYSKHWALPVTELQLSPEFKELKLNNSYTAKIYPDKVVVGCQEFSIETIKELAKLIN